MKLSLAKVFCRRPGVRIQEGRNGVSESQCTVVRMFAIWYGMARSWWTLPGCESSCANSASSPVRSFTDTSFGLLGANRAFRILAGFSAWLWLSLVFLATAYLMLSRQNGVRLRPFVGLGLVVSVTFCAVSLVCFIIPPTVGAVLATALFAISWIKREH